MTNYEYLKTRTKGFGLTDDEIEIILLKSGLQGTGSVDMTACDKAMLANFSIIRKSATEKIREGGYSIERNMNAIESFRRTLIEETEDLSDPSSLW